MGQRAGDRGPDNGRDQERPQRRTFVFLLLVTSLLMVGLAVLLWWVPYVGLTAIHPRLPLILAVVMGCAVLFGLGAVLTLLFTILRGRNLFFNRRIRGIVIRFLFPLLVVVGKCFGIGKSSIRRSFVAINNQLVLAEARAVKPEKLLLLLPHCLQNNDCPVKITGNVENCKRCGKCKIKDLLELAHKYHVFMTVATGGTLARKIVRETRPNLIVAVACERDLTSGIQDSFPLPVYGVFNRRPFGPCFNTEVDLDAVEEGLATFLGRVASGDAEQETGGQKHETGAIEKAGP